MYSLSQKIITPYNLKFPNKINFNHKEKKKNSKKILFPLKNFMTSLPLNSTLPPSLFNQKQKSWSRRKGGKEEREKERKKKGHAIRPRDNVGRARDGRRR